MLTGAIAGALLVIHALSAWALDAAAVLLAGVAVAAQRKQRTKHLTCGFRKWS